jgi:hypothetical protein
MVVNPEMTLTENRLFGVYPKAFALEARAEIRYQTGRSPQELAGMATQQRSAATTASRTSIGGEMPEVVYRPVPPSIFFTRFNTFPCESVSIECVRLRLKKILEGRARSCNRTRSADALRDRPLLERTAMRGRDAWMRSTLGGSVPPRNRSIRSRPRYLHHTLVRHRLSRPRVGGRRDRRTRRIPLGGNLVRIARTFEPFPDPIRP